jgi:hypothetical protein
MTGYVVPPATPTATPPPTKRSPLLATSNANVPSWVNWSPLSRSSSTVHVPDPLTSTRLSAPTVTTPPSTAFAWISDPLTQPLQARSSAAPPWVADPAYLNDTSLGEMLPSWMSDEFTVPSAMLVPVTQPTQSNPGGVHSQPSAP